MVISEIAAVLYNATKQSKMGWRFELGRAELVISCSFSTLLLRREITYKELEFSVGMKEYILSTVELMEASVEAKAKELVYKINYGEK